MQTRSVLEALGVAEIEEGIYRAVLKGPRSSVAEIVHSVGVSRTAIHDALTSLETKGLVSRVPGRPVRYVPTPPDVAIEVLVRQRQQEIERARASSTQLLEEFRQGAERVPGDVVQVVAGREAVIQRFEQLQRTAQNEICMFDRPPYARGNILNSTELELLKQGVRYRVIYDQRAFEIPGQNEWLQELTAAGEEARVLPSVPIKLDLADDRLGLVPLGLDEPGVQMRLLVYPSPLLVALRVVFESLWERAIPVYQPPAVSDSAVTPSEADQRVLALMATGLKDAAIANQLNLGIRTVRRRVERLMNELGASTRYQAGLQAARRGWS